MCYQFSGILLDHRPISSFIWLPEKKLHSTFGCYYKESWVDLTLQSMNILFSIKPSKIFYGWLSFILSANLNILKGKFTFFTFTDWILLLNKYYSLFSLPYNCNNSKFMLFPLLFLRKCINELNNICLYSLWEENELSRRRIKMSMSGALQPSLTSFNF